MSTVEWGAGCGDSGWTLVAAGWPWVWEAEEHSEPGVVVAALAVRLS